MNFTCSTWVGTSITQDCVFKHRYRYHFVVYDVYWRKLPWEHQPLPEMLLSNKRRAHCMLPSNNLLLHKNVFSFIIIITSTHVIHVRMNEIRNPVEDYIKIQFSQLICYIATKTRFLKSKLWYLIRMKSCNARLSFKIRVKCWNGTGRVCLVQ